MIHPEDIGDFEYKRRLEDQAIAELEEQEICDQCNQPLKDHDDGECPRAEWLDERQETACRGFDV